MQRVQPMRPSSGEEPGGSFQPGGGLDQLEVGYSGIYWDYKMVYGM